ncbi:D-amino acid dehydrogenase [Bordetella sp. BOR01]|uniref:D-amino acid dehydrogenase n=1 Tax=Bordetella sp. BOR01 TaxID=2854779 RepID=UPI001C468BE2|nr:D-amino acid dehydrogenase [Bordetella sp. BOR01]MBV7483516.1 D-amino acid dehydrogenase [Bordetella sp. BOR01]
MHIVVIGAGIIGMTTAYFLREAGHAVSVVESGPRPGLETSQANGAQLSYSFVAPLADPAVLPKLPSWLTDKNGPLRLRLRADPELWRWGLGFLRACRHGIAQRTTEELLQLGLYSRTLMHQLVAREQLDFNFSSSGKLLVYQDAGAYAGALAQMRYQVSLGCEQRALDARDCLALEPALADISARVVGGIFTPTEDAGDCLKLCTELQRTLAASADPVRFHFNTEVRRLRMQQGRVVALDTAGGQIEADGYVIANGVGAQRLARQAGMNPLIYPLKGYSLTYALTARSRAPMTSLSDVHNKVVYARLGDRLRVAGMMDIGDRSMAIDAGRIASLKSQVARYLPRLEPAGEPQAWAGLRPARPDSKPVIGATPYRNLWINAGHGALGFTLAAGSAGLLAERIAGRATAIGQHSFTL